MSNFALNAGLYLVISAPLSAPLSAPFLSAPISAPLSAFCECREANL